MTFLPSDTIFVYDIPRTFEITIHCPRCSSESEENERYCWLCQWDFHAGSRICDGCGLEVKAGRECFICDPTAGWMSPGEDA